MKEYDNLEVSLDDDVFRIALDRPEHDNAINAELHEELGDVFKESQDSDARVVLLTGNGDTFSVGGDFEWFQDCIDDPQKWRDAMSDGEDIIKDIINIEKPVIAKLNGDAIGGGATYALFCDIVVASEDARIGDPHVKAGLAAGDGGAVIWPLLTGINKAKELLMTGRLLSAQEALEMGVVSHAVPETDLDEKTDEIINELASGPQLAIRYTKMAVNGWVELGLNNIFRESLALEAVTQQHEDHRQAVEDFRNKRQPNYPSGRDTSD